LIKARGNFYKEHNCVETLKNISNVENGTASPADAAKAKEVKAMVDNWVANNAEPDINLVNMSQPDTDAIKEIVSSVSEDTYPVSKTTKQEVADLFVKYNMTADDIRIFKTYGPGFIFANYDLLFFNDAWSPLKKVSP